MKKTAVITGGTKGIGKSIVVKFASEGFTIFTCARNEQELEALKKEIEGSYNVDCHVFQADLSRKAEVDKFAKFVQSATSAINVLVNNTGFFIPGEVHTEEDGVLEAMIDTNLYSAYYLTRALIPDMIARRSGDVFNMCSIASITPYPNGGSYSISKYALYGMTKVLREEMKEKGIRVMAILPGATMSASWEGADIPEDRLAKPEDIAASIWSAHNLSERAVVEEIIVRPQLGDL